MTPYWRVPIATHPQDDGALYFATPLLCRRGDAIILAHTPSGARAYLVRRRWRWLDRLYRLVTRR